MNNPFETCELPGVYFHSIGNEKAKAIHIKSQSDYDDNFIMLNNEKRDDKEWLNLAGEYKSLKAQEKILKKRMDQVKNDLIGLSESVTSIGGGIQLEKCERKGTILYSEIPQLKDIDLENYRGDSITYYKVTEI